MKQFNTDIGSLIEKALAQNYPSVSFESAWSAAHINNNKRLPGKTAAIPLTIVITLIILCVVGFTSYRIWRIVDNTNYPFINDTAAIGKWQSVDFVEKIADFTPEKRSWKGNLFLTSLVFLKDGKMLNSYENGNLAYAPSSWTKGMVLNRQEKTAGSYEIREINGQSYMFFEWKSGDYVFNDMKPYYYVLKKVDSKDYSDYQAAPVKEDKTDYPFVDDSQMKGKWESVDFVKTVDSFKPGEKSWPGDLFLIGLALDENGKLTIITTSGKYLNPSITWTKGLIIDKSDKTASKCEIKKINGTTYMFFEWKNGDYVYRGMKPSYYVLKKD